MYRIWQAERRTATYRTGQSPLRPLLWILLESAALLVVVEVVLLALYSAGLSCQYLLLEPVTPIVVRDFDTYLSAMTFVDISHRVSRSLPSLFGSRFDKESRGAVSRPLDADAPVQRHLTRQSAPFPCAPLQSVSPRTLRTAAIPTSATPPLSPMTRKPTSTQKSKWPETPDHTIRIRRRTAILLRFSLTSSFSLRSFPPSLRHIDPLSFDPPVPIVTATVSRCGTHQCYIIFASVSSLPLSLVCSLCFLYCRPNLRAISGSSIRTYMYQYIALFGPPVSQPFFCANASL